MPHVLHRTLFQSCVRHLLACTNYFWQYEATPDVLRPTLQSTNLPKMLTRMMQRLKSTSKSRRFQPHSRCHHPQHQRMSMTSLTSSNFLLFATFYVPPPSPANEQANLSKPGKRSDSLKLQLWTTAYLTAPALPSSSTGLPMAAVGYPVLTTPSSTPSYHPSLNIPLHLSIQLRSLPHPSRLHRHQ